MVGKNTISTIAPGQSTDSPRRSQFDSPNNQGFLDFIMNNISEMQASLNKKFDLSKDLNGICLFSRVITPDELINRTSKDFSEEYISDSNAKIYENFVFVSGISDTLVSLTEQELEVFHLLRASERRFLEYSTNRAKNPPAETQDALLETILKHFKKTEERRFVVNHIQKKVESFHRFYYKGAEDSFAPIGLSQCKVRFHDKNNLQFGKFVKSLATKVGFNSSTRGIEASLKSVRKLIAAAPIGTSTSKNSKLKEQITGAASNSIPNLDTMGA